MFKKHNIKNVSWYGFSFFEKNFPYFYKRFIKKYYIKKLILNIKGYNYLKSKNQLELGRKLKLEIERVELNLNQNKCSKLIFGNHVDKADIIVKQNILYNFIQDTKLPSFTSSLLSAVNRNYTFTHPLPSEFNYILKKYGFKLSYKKNTFYWYFFIFLFFLLGVKEILKIIFSSLFNIFFIRKQVPSDSIYFNHLNEFSVPRNLQDSKNHNIINWYIKNNNYFKNEKNIYHGVKSIKKVSYGEYNINYSPIVPLFLNISSLFFFIFWSFFAILFCFFDIFRGRWWHSLLLMESSKLKLFSLQNKNYFHTYLFNNSSFLRRPLWSYEAEKRGCKIIFYFYSTNNQIYLTETISDPTPFGWKNTSWPNYLVWDNFQKKFIEKYSNNIKNIAIVGSIWFSDFDQTFIKPNKKFISVFDISPARDVFNKTFLVPETFPKVDFIINFLEDIYHIAEKLDYLMVLKIKRSLTNVHHPKYIRFLNNFSKLNNSLVVHPETSSFSIIQQSSKIISAPFCTPSLTAKINKIPSIYYDPQFSFLKNNPAAHDIEVINNKSALEKWIINN